MMEADIEDWLAAEPSILSPSEPDLPWRSPLVRDLAWAIGSPPLVSIDDATTWPRSDWFRRQLIGFAPALDRLEREPTEGSGNLPGTGGKRLGAYFESLIAFWLERDERYRVLARNLPVRRPIRRGGRQTLGELDLIVENRVRDRVEHWEIAVKFYLGRLPGTMSTGAPEWVGPGLKDRLDTKVQRLAEHQLKLPANERARAVLAERGVDVSTSRVIMKGRLFYPLSEQIQPPSMAAADHLRGWWMRTCDFPDRFADSGWSWRRLTRYEWLAPVAYTARHNEETLDAPAFARTGDIRAARWPRMVVGLRDGHEMTRGFLVPPGWGVQEPAR